MITFDIEADNLLRDATIIHCLVLKEANSSALEVYYNGPYLGELSDPDALRVGKLSDGLMKLTSHKGQKVGHNIAGYDIPLLEKLPKISISLKVSLDTLVLSSLLYPERSSHSLEQWALDLKLPDIKIQNSDWSKLTLNMVNRCVADVKINEGLALHLLKESYETLGGPLSLETEVSYIQAKQEVHGVRYDVMQAVETLNIFDKKITKLTKEIREGVPPTPKIPGISKIGQQEIREGPLLHYDPTGSKPFKKGGGLKQAVCNYFDGDVGTVKGPYSKVHFEQLNLNSHDQVKAYLLSIGWKPTEWNFKVNQFTGRKEKTSPKLTEESYKSLPPGLGQKIADLYVLKHRRRSISNEKDPSKGALATVRDDGRVPAEAFTCATPTSRYRHQRTVCNIPRPSSPYGQEIRELFCVPSDRWMLGVDLSGIEARMMCHYVLVVAELSGDAEKYEAAKKMVDVVINGDFHQFNADNWGVSRDDAKSGLYALTYQGI